MPEKDLERAFDLLLDTFSVDGIPMIEICRPPQAVFRKPLTPEEKLWNLAKSLLINLNKRAAPMTTAAQAYEWTFVQLHKVHDVSIIDKVSSLILSHKQKRVNLTLAFDDPNNGFASL